MDVVAEEQRTGVFRDVGQRLTGIVRIVEHFRVGIAVAGDNAQVIGQRTGQIYLDAA